MKIVRRKARRRVAFQGEFGAHSELVAEKFGAPVPFASFERVFEAVLNGEVECGAIPIANAIAGAVKENAELLWRHQRRVKIVAETVAPISHCLLGLRGSSIRAAREVHSHWQALAQCQKFFARHPRLKPVETYDTAGSAKRIAETGDLSQLAIASERAAKRYGLRVLKRDIGDAKWNATQFYLIARADSELTLSRRIEKTVFICRSLSEIQPFVSKLLRLEPIATRRRAFETHYLAEVSGAAGAENVQSLGAFGRV
ncbi:MAG: prephenate dehydratase [Chloroherpetonaceae bacterium]|nr:prephenate dehydratase [Chloroherpetonaceae bacterium]